MSIMIDIDIIVNVLVLVPVIVIVIVISYSNNDNNNNNTRAPSAAGPCHCVREGWREGYGRPRERTEPTNLRVVGL